MKSLIIIWLLVLITLMGGGLYVNNALGNMLVEVNTSVLTPRTSLEVVYNYNEQKTANINVLEPKVAAPAYQWSASVNAGVLVEPLIIYGSLETDGLRKVGRNGQR